MRSSNTCHDKVVEGANRSRRCHGNSQLLHLADELMDFSDLDRDVEAAAAADEKYRRENSAKFRAVEQKVATYEQFRDIVKASHLTPLDKKEKIADPSLQYKNVIWNTAATGRSEPDIINRSKEKKRHFTEK